VTLSARSRWKAASVDNIFPFVIIGNHPSFGGTNTTPAKTLEFRWPYSTDGTTS
jgi:hypothetical protein